MSPENLQFHIVCHIIYPWRSSDSPSQVMLFMCGGGEMAFAWRFQICSTFILVVLLLKWIQGLDVKGQTEESFMLIISLTIFLLSDYAEILFLFFWPSILFLFL